MANIKKYTKKDGSTTYMFNAYLGVDPLTGKSKRTTRRGFRTQKEAKLALAQLQLEIESGGFVKQDYSRFKDVYELWFEQYKNTVKETSAHRIQSCFNNQILPYFGNYKIEKISPSYCQSVINKWNIKYSSITFPKTFLNKVFKFSVNQNIIQSNPLEKVVIPRKEKSINKERENFLDKNQLISFLNEIESKENQMIFTAFTVLAYTGLRRGELFALKWSDLNFNNETLSINKTISYFGNQAKVSSTKTKNSNRTISIDSSTLSLLKKWKLNQKKVLLSRGIRVQNDDIQLIFTDHRNNVCGKNLLANILSRYPEFKITTHGFRHTHASLLFESGATIKQVQERLGHTDVQTTLNIYTHVSKKVEKDTAKSFLDFMNS
ncbi:TPA: site-specific integrase [Enterococcus faecalis]